MIHHSIYTAIKERLLTTVPADATPVKMVDWFNGQPDLLEGGGQGMDGYTYPLVLVRFEAAQWLALGRKGYECDGLVYLDVVQPGTDRLVNDAGPLEQARAATALQHVQAIETALDGLRGSGTWGSFGPLMVGMNEMDHAYRRIRVDTLAFRSRWYKSNNRQELEHAPNDLNETQDVVDVLP